MSTDNTDNKPKDSTVEVKQNRHLPPPIQPTKTTESEKSKSEDKKSE